MILGIDMSGTTTRIAQVNENVFYIKLRSMSIHERITRQEVGS